MFFKALKQKSAQKILERSLREKTRGNHLTDRKITHVGCIIEDEFLDEVEPLKHYFSEIGIHPNDLHFLIHSKEKQGTGELFSRYFHKEDFGWTGRLQNDSLQEFLSRPYQLLINFYEDDQQWSAKLASVMCKADLSVGLSSIDHRVNDIAIDCTPGQLSVFKNELTKYLKVLKKIE